LRHDLLGEDASQGISDRQRLGGRDRSDAGAHRLAGLVDVQRVRVVALHAADDLDDALHARPSSSRVLMLRNASASSSKLTSITCKDAYQASIFRPPPARKASRFAATERRTSANTGCAWSPVLATARSFVPSARCRRSTRSAGRKGESHGTVTVSGRETAARPACRPARGPA